MKKLVITLLLAVSFCASAQNIDRFSNFQINVGGGLNTLRYLPVDGDWNMGFGAIADFQYQLMFNHSIGLAFGAELGWLNSAAEYNFQDRQTGLVHPDDNRAYDRITIYENYRESQTALCLGIPVEIIIRTPGDRFSFQMGLGVSYNHPLLARYSSSDIYKIQGYFPDVNATVEALPEHGFTNTQDVKTANMSFANYWAGVADLGMVGNLNDYLGLYLGLYGRLSLNKVETERNAPYLDEVNEHYIGTFNTRRVDKFRPIEFGLKIGLRIGAGRDVDWERNKAAEEARLAAEKAEQERLAAEAAERERLAAEEKARAEAEARAKAEAEARAAAAAKAAAEAKAKAEADSVARAHAAELAKAKSEAEAELARAKAEAEARIKAEAEARAKAEAEARAKAKAEQKAREEAAFLAGYKDVAHFETGKDMPIFTELNEDSWDNLKDVMDRYPEVRVIVTGYTDNVGKPASNMNLSQRRADNIKSMLVGKGISADRIEAVGKGDADPVASNKTAEGRAQNRRIEITIFRSK